MNLNYFNVIEFPLKWDPNILKRFFRFYCECYNNRLIKFTSLSSLIDIFINKINSNSPKNIRQLFVYIIASNLNLIYDNLNQENKEYLERLINQIDDFILRSNSKEEKFVINCKKVFKNNTTDNYLNNTWLFIKENILKNNHKMTKLVLNLPVFKLNEIERLDIYFKDDLNLNYDYLLYSSSLVNPYDDVTQDMNIKVELLSFKEFNEFETFLIREYFDEIIFSFKDNLEKVYFYFKNFLNFYGIEEEIERDEKNSNDNNYHLNDFLNITFVNVIFSQIMNTQNVEKYNVTYLSSLLFNLTKQNKNFIPIINRIISKILIQISNTDIQSITNFSYFLSFYISNFQFKFNLENPHVTGNNLKSEIFMKMLLDSLVNLGTKSKLQEMYSNSPDVFEKETFEKFLKNYSDKPNWKFYFGEQFHYDTVVINDNIQNKKELQLWKDKFESSGNEFIYVLMSCLFYYKSKTLTHLRETLNFYNNSLINLINSKDKQIILLNALFDVWDNSSVYLRFIVEYLLNINLVEHSVLVNYLINKKISEKIENFVYFELMDLAITHPVKSLERSRLFLIKEQKSLAQSDETNQANIIGQIEQLEINIERMNSVCESLPAEALFQLFKLYSTFSLSFKNQHNNQFVTDYIFERILQICRKFKRNLSENLKNVQANLKIHNTEHADIQKLIENFNSL